MSWKIVRCSSFQIPNDNIKELKPNTVYNFFVCLRNSLILNYMTGFLPVWVSNPWCLHVEASYVRIIISSCLKSNFWCCSFDKNLPNSLIVIVAPAFRLAYLTSFNGKYTKTKVNMGLSTNFLNSSSSSSRLVNSRTSAMNSWTSNTCLPFCVFLFTLTVYVRNTNF